MSTASRQEGYQNAAMQRDEAVDIAANIGVILSRKDLLGRPMPMTARVNLAARGEGFDLIIPAELVCILYSKGLEDGGKETAASE